MSPPKRRRNQPMEAFDDSDDNDNTSKNSSDSDDDDDDEQPLRRKSATTTKRRAADTADGEDEVEDGVNATEKFRQFLVKWSEEYHIRSDSLSALLAYFKANSFPALPTNASTLHQQTSSGEGGGGGSSSAALRRVNTTVQQIGHVLVAMKRQQHADATDVKRALLHSEQTNAARFDALMGQMKAMMERSGGGGFGGFGGNSSCISPFGRSRSGAEASNVVPKLDEEFEEPQWPLKTSFEINELNERLRDPGYRREMFACMDAWQIFVRDNTRKTVKKYMEHMFSYEALFEYSWTGKTSIDQTLATKLQFEKLSHIIKLIIDVVKLPVNDVTNELKYFMKRVPQSHRAHVLQRSGGGSDAQQNNTPI